MKKLLILIGILFSVNHSFAQTAANKTPPTPPKFLSLAKNLVISLEHVQTVVNDNKPYSEVSMLLRGKLRNNVHSMDQTLNFSKGDLIKKIGEKDYNELDGLLKNYFSIVDKTEPLSPNEIQSATLWLKLWSTKIDELIVKLIR